MKLKPVICTLLTVASGLIAHAEQQTEAYNVDFLVNSSKLSTSVADNARTLEQLSRFLREAMGNDSIKIVDIKYCGYASPEGPTDLNRRLSKARCQSLEEYVNTRATFPEATVSEGSEIDIWSEVIGQLSKSDYEYASEAIDILNDDTAETNRNNPYAARVARLKRLHNGKVWKYINSNILAPMRNATVTFVTFIKETPKPIVIDEQQPPLIEQEEIVYVEDTPTQAEEETEPEWQPHLYLKTNAVAWAMLISNAAVEYEFHPHWSVTAPIYYSGVNYFTRKVKFRTLAFQPELRYWFRNNNKDGFFVGAHFGVAKYNFAIGGTYRFQDHHAKYPALGGGISIGYRIPLSKDRKWKMEFTAGGGYYHLWTDHFLNETNGPKIYKNKKNMFLVDNVGVTFMYMFDLNRGGKK